MSEEYEKELRLELYQSFSWAALRLADILIARDKRLIGWIARGKASDMPNQTYAEYLSEAEGILEEIEDAS